MVKFILSFQASVLSLFSYIFNLIKKIVIVLAYFKFSNFILSFLDLSVFVLAVSIVALCLDISIFLICGFFEVILTSYEVISNIIIPITFNALVKAPFFILFYSLGWIHYENGILPLIFENREFVICEGLSPFPKLILTKIIEFNYTALQVSGDVSIFCFFVLAVALIFKSIGFLIGTVETPPTSPPSSASSPGEPQEIFIESDPLLSPPAPVEFNSFVECLVEVGSFEIALLITKLSVPEIPSVLDANCLLGEDEVIFNIWKMLWGATIACIDPVGVMSVHLPIWVSLLPVSTITGFFSDVSRYNFNSPLDRVLG